MCNHKTLLARHSQRHYISQCEHGTLHLVWMHTTLHLNPTLMCELTDLLNAWAADEYDLELLEHRMAEVRLERAAFDLHYLWIEHTALRLSAAELSMLQQMVARADALLREMVVELHHQPATCNEPLDSMPVLQPVVQEQTPLVDAGYCHELAVATQRGYTLN